MEEGFIDLVCVGFQSGRTGIPSDGYVLDGAQLSMITAPVIYLIGDSDVFAMSERRLERSNALNPSSQMILVKNAGYGMITDEGDIVCDYGRSMHRAGE